MYYKIDCVFKAFAKHGVDPNVQQRDAHLTRALPEAESSADFVQLQRYAQQRLMPTMVPGDGAGFVVDYTPGGGAPGHYGGY